MTLPRRNYLLKDCVSPVATFHCKGCACLHQLPLHRETVEMVLEELEAAVDHRRINACPKFCIRQFEQDYERFRLVVVRFRVEDE